jgi:RHS repeat-associated protein
VATGSGVTGYAYDPLGRLSVVSRAAATDTYAYDAAGNRTAATGQAPTFEPGHRLTSDGTFDYAYDDEGNLVSRSLVATGATTTYTWDAFNRLVRVDHPAGGVTTYRYDAYGRRIEVDDRGSITRHVHDGANVALAYDGANVLRKSYVTGDEPGAAYAVDEAGATHFYLRDGLGSVVALVDEAGAVSERLTYGAWGELAAAPVIDATYTYTGHTYDPATGWYFARARWYDPAVGRFTSTDPLPCLNPYPYASNDPINFSDPTGEAALAEYGATSSQSARQAILLREVGFYICGQLANAAILGLGLGPNAMGQMGEDFIRNQLGGTGAQSQVPYGGASGRNRIADFIRGADVIEVKNVNSQSLTSQIKDLIAKAGRNGRPILVVRTSTNISGPLAAAMKRAGGMIIGCLPG